MRASFTNKQKNLVKLRHAITFDIICLQMTNRTFQECDWISQINNTDRNDLGVLD